MAEKKHTMSDLYQMQSLPLDAKVSMTKQRIKGWYDYWDGEVYISFSGGKDSTVLLDIARSMYKDIPCVFIDTGLEYPEIREFVNKFEEVEWLKPKLNFKQVIEKYGYPFISKEVSECVYGARKYLTSLVEEGIVRQTDRQTDRPYRYFYEKLCGQGKYAKSDTGGGDNKYRKLRGIGEYSKRTNGQQHGWKQSEIGNHVGNAYEGQGSSDKGEYP